jgi:hypothetical protein
METWYTSYNRFERKIINRWHSQGFRYNRGHINLLRYSYQTTMFWGLSKGRKLSKENAIQGHPVLF